MLSEVCNMQILHCLCLMKGIYFEERGLMLLDRLGMTKSEFARRMGIQRQNVNVLFKTNNIEIIARAAEVLGVPLALLVGYVEEPEVYELPVPEFHKESLDLATLEVAQSVIEEI